MKMIIDLKRKMELIVAFYLNYIALFKRTLLYLESEDSQGRALELKLSL
jgi:hypothetical protein